MNEKLKFILTLAVLMPKDMLINQISNAIKTYNANKSKENEDNIIFSIQMYMAHNMSDGDINKINKIIEDVENLKNGILNISLN